MKKFIFVSLFTISIFSSYIQAQLTVNSPIIEPEMASLGGSEQPGGFYMPSVARDGKYVKVLIVFVQFKDDNWNPTWSQWQKNQPPAWMGTNIIDPTTTQNSTNQNLSHYYTEMSLGNYKVVGDCYHVVTPRTRDEYISEGIGRGGINREALQTLNDNSNINFSDYDLWNKAGTYDEITWGQDGEVDMIWMVYRNIGEDRDDEGKTIYELDFGNRKITTNSDFTKDTSYTKFSGEASLWFASDLNLDGVRVDFGSFGLVSGITIMQGYRGLDRVKSLIIHEYGHHLLGGMNMHIKTGVWGMMAGYGSRSQMANSFERHRLGWINPLQYDYNPLLAISLRDYVEYGDALRIKIPGSSNPVRYYYLENHQRENVFDNIDKSGEGKGVYVLYQDGDSNDDLEFYNAEGRFSWSVDHFAWYPNEDSVRVAVFEKGFPDPSGSFDTESIVYTDPNTGNNTSAPIEAYIDEITGNDVFYPLFAGDGKDAMNPGYVEIFSPYTNPSVENISFRVFAENNQIKVMQKVEENTILDLPPSKPKNLNVGPSANMHPLLIWSGNAEPDINKYNIYKKSSSTAAWEFMAATTDTSYEDMTERYIIDHQAFTTYVYYSITCVDSSSQESIKSDESKAKVKGNYLEKKGSDQMKGDSAIPQINEYNLAVNFPNPFNPSTTITYSLPKKGEVVLKIYNSLGQEIKTLVNEFKEEGIHKVNFDASDLPSGVYIYSIQANDFHQSKKMILLK